MRILSWGFRLPLAQEVSPPKPLGADITGEFSKSIIWSSCFIFKVFKRRNDNLLYICLLLCGSCFERTESQVGDSWSLEHIAHIPPTPTFVSAGLYLKPAHPPLTVLGERAAGHHHPGPVFSQVHGAPSRTAWTSYRLPNTYNLAFPVYSGQISSIA